MFKSTNGTHRVQASQESTQPLEDLGVLQFGAATSMAGTDRDTMYGTWCAYDGERRGIALQFDVAASGCQRARGDDRHIGSGQFNCKGVFLEDLHIAPSPRSVELGHHHSAVFQVHLEDAVLIGVQLKQPSISAQADCVERVQHAKWIEFCIAEEAVRGDRARGHARIVGVQLCVPVPG